MSFDRSKTPTWRPGYRFQYDGTPTGPVTSLDAKAADHKVTLTWKKPASAHGLHHAA